GGMGRVYLAEHPIIGKRAAVKVLLPEYSRRVDMVKRFFNEARSISRLKHAGVIDVYDFGFLPDGAAYIIMEFLEGRSLRTYLRQTGRASPELIIEVARQVATTLAEVHARGIVHRDLKPDNIFLVD